ILKMQAEALMIVVRGAIFPLTWWSTTNHTTATTTLPFKQYPRNPFDEAQLPVFLTSQRLSVNTSRLQDFRIDQFRYIGYLSQQAKTIAVLLLPDGSVDEVSINALVGKEPWRVYHISQQMITLISLDKTKRRQLLKDEAND